MASTRACYFVGEGILALPRHVRSGATSPVFLPVALSPPSPPVTPIRSTETSVLEIQLAGGRVVRVDADVDAAKLAAIVAALEKMA
jgi:hypothetical protein